MNQTGKTAIVLRYANYREYDRMLTLFSPTRGRVEALCRGCRKPRSALLSAGEMFALGDFELYEKGGRNTVTSASLIETFYPLRADYERLTAGVYLLNLAEEAIQPDKPDQELFMLLLHALSRLAFYDQPWRPLLAGFMLHYAAAGGFAPELDRCVRCGRSLAPDGRVRFDIEAGGLCCAACARPGQLAMTAEEAAWMRTMRTKGSAAWTDTPEAPAPYAVLRRFTEAQIGRPLHAGSALPVK